MYLLYSALFVCFILSHKLIHVEANGNPCDQRLIVHTEIDHVHVHVIASISHVRVQPTFHWSCMENIHGPSYQGKRCCWDTIAISNEGVWENICEANTYPLYVTYTRRKYFRVEITEGECQNTSAILEDSYKLPNNDWYLERSNVYNPLEYTCSTNNKPNRMTWRLLTVRDSDILTYKVVVNLTTCDTYGDSVTYENMSCVERDTFHQVNIRMNHSLLDNDKMYMICVDEYDDPHWLHYTGSNVVDLNQIDLNIKGIHAGEIVIGSQTLTLTTILSGKSQDPVFHWTLVSKDLHAVIFKPCSSSQTTTNIPGWSYVSTCDLRFIDDIRSFIEPLLVKVTVIDMNTVNTSSILKTTVTFSAPWKLHVIYNPLTIITCSFNQSENVEGVIKLKFIIPDFKIDVIIDTDMCTLSYNRFIKTVECKTEKGLTKIRVITRRVLKYIYGVYIRCHAVYDVTRGTAYLHLNTTGFDGNGSFNFRELYIEELDNKDTALFHQSLRLTAVLSGTSLYPIFQWSIVEGKSQDVLFQVCSSQKTRIGIPGFTYTSTCNLKHMYIVSLFIEPLVIRVTVQDNGISTTASTTIKPNASFSEPWTIQSAMEPHTTITCTYNHSEYDDKFIKFSFITSVFMHHVIINIDGCLLSRNPFIKDVECHAAGRIEIIRVYLWEDLKYSGDMYSRCHSVTDVSVGSIYIPIHHAVHMQTSYTELSLLTSVGCVMLVIVNMVIIINYGRPLIAKCKGCLFKHEDENQVYSTINDQGQSRLSLESHENSFNENQNIEAEYSTVTVITPQTHQN